MQRLSYLQARVLLLVLGFVLAATQTFLAWERGAQPTEVLAPALYAPIFAAAIFGGLIGGLIAAAVMSALYGAVLSEQVAALGIGVFLGLLGTRIFLYVFYAVIVAVGTKYLESRLRKLELYDQIDDTTGLYNSSFFLTEVDLERSRAVRYQTFFSVAELAISREAMGNSPKKLLKDIARRVQDAIRHVDRACRIPDDGAERFLVILPQTGREGANVFTERLRDATRTYLADRARVPAEQITARAVPVEDAAALDELVADVNRIEERRRAIRPS